MMITISQHSGWPTEMCKQAVNNPNNPEHKNRYNLYNLWLFKKVEGPPGGPMVENPPSYAGNGGLIPGWGIKIPHATGQQLHVPQPLSLRALVCTKKVEKTVHCNEDPARPK